MYGIGKNSRRLYRIDANGTVEDLGPLSLDNSQAVIGGAISPDGRSATACSDGSGVGPSAPLTPGPGTLELIIISLP